MLPIYVDLDDVICDTTHPCIQVIKSMFNREVPYEQVTSFDFKDVFDLSPAEFDEFMTVVHQPDVLLRFEPIQEAIDVLTQWSEEGYHIAIVTGRPPSSYAASVEWLSNHRIPYDSFLMVNKYDRQDPDGDHVISISDFSKMSFSFAIEDSLEMAEYISGTMGRPVALFDRPWNRAVDVNGNITRYESWKQIAKGVSRFPSIFSLS